MSIKGKVRMEEEDLQMSEPVFTSGTQNNKKCTTCNESAAATIPSFKATLIKHQYSKTPKSTTVYVRKSGGMMLLD